jgi:hypothetical protein
MGMSKSRNRTVRPAKPFAARVYMGFSKVFNLEESVPTYYDTVVPGKDSELVQAGDKVPASSNVSSKEDAESED